MAKRELLAFEAPTATSGGGTIYPATQTGASLAGTAASTGVVAVKGASIAWRAVIVASLLVAGTATISVGIAASCGARKQMVRHTMICYGILLYVMDTCPFIGGYMSLYYARFIKLKICMDY